MFGLTQNLHVLDTETSSDVDIRKAGAYRYFASPHTRTLMVGFEDQPSRDPHVWETRDAGSLLRIRLDQIVAEPPEQSMFCAFNAAFDRQALAKHGMPTPAHKWLDLALLAYALCFTGSLDEVCKQFELPVAKNPDGSRLISKFSKTRKPWYEHPDDWTKFVAYCADDVRTERALLDACAKVLDTPAFRPMVQSLQRDWLMDQEINERGLPVGMDRLRGALRIKGQETARLVDVMKEKTGLDNPNSRDQLFAWANAHDGVNLPDLRAEHIRDQIDYLPPAVADVLRMRLDIGKASVKKFDAFAARQVDGRIKGAYITAGASRTGRTASRGANMSNIERPKLDNPPVAASILETGNADLVRLLYDEPVMTVLGSCVRAALQAPEGKMFCVYDLKSIESVGLAWLSGCQTILDIFFAGRDTYKSFAVEAFNVPYEKVTKEQRTYSKPPVLGCFSADTLVLTDSGWKEIIRIQNLDQLWDGEQWVTHTGVKYRGQKQTIKKYGVTATPDHLILTDHEQWTPWEGVRCESIKRATELASGYYSNMTVNTGCANVRVERSPGWTPTPSTLQGVNHVSLAPTGGFSTLRGLWQEVWALIRSTWSVCPTVSTRNGPDARTQKTPNLSITAGAALNAVSRLRKTQSGITSPCLGGTTLTWKLIELITTAITSLGTFGSLTGVVTHQTPALIASSFTRVNGTPPPSFTSSSAQNTAAKETSRGRSTRECPLNRSSQNRSFAVAPTFDVTNAGPNSRYTIWSEAGPIIVHNSGFGASGRALVDYAAGMNITLDEEEANRLVKVFRTAYPEIPRYWRALETAARNAILAPGRTFSAGPTGREVYYNSDRVFLRCRIPSGRTIFYYKPEIRKREPRPGWIVDAIHYWGRSQGDAGRWQQISAFPGGLAENCTQALCRDVMYHGLHLVNANPAIEIVGSTYDEAITLIDEDDAEAPAFIERCMTTRAPWMDDQFFLGCEGTVTKEYGK